MRHDFMPSPNLGTYLSYPGGGEGITIEGGREKKEETGGGRGGEKGHLPFI
jgi:hypothetical protein